ncbi:UNVERIFIED_CONTAM: hypothetical protein Slati_4560900 [Sesamum latifolium]|uniref:Uncharacterized protein n=1 Tax=Sesamum latifolium TaxID=2727402 RepID=A0AAW2S1L5_9LAMI
MLSYVAPVIQNDEIIVRPMLAMSRDGACRWASTAVGSAYHPTAVGTGYGLAQAQTHASPGMVTSETFTSGVLDNEGLSIVASGIGRPLYQDVITKACTRLDFARVCVMLDISSKLPKHVVVMIPGDGGGRLLVEWMWSMSGSRQNA